MPLSLRLMGILILAFGSGCGSGHVTPKYQPYYIPTGGCTDEVGPELETEAFRTLGADLGFVNGGDRLILEQLRGDTAKFRVSVDGIPHCTRRVIASGPNTSGQRSLPPIADRDPWHDPDDTIAIVEQLTGTTIDLRSVPEACWFESDDALHPAWMFEGLAAGKPTRWFASGDTIFRQNELTFFMDGTATIYDSHPGSPFVEVPLRDLDGSGFLSNPRFITDLPSDIPRAHSPDFRFEYSTSDIRFNELSVFANAERMATFLEREEFGYNMNCLPIHLRMPDRTKSHEGEWEPVNNAAYIPPNFNSEGSFALIRIGEGDGVGLKSLMLDADVIYHEIGHHVVFRTLKSTAYNSRMIHEAMADYFLFAKTGNACVGEGICPAGTDNCWTSRCLRTGENDMRLTDDDLPSGYHQRSQILSGMLWDLRRELGAGVMDRLAFAAVDNFLWESDFADFIFAFMLADQKLNDGVHACRIFDAAISRGLKKKLRHLDCNDFAQPYSR